LAAAIGPLNGVPASDSAAEAPISAAMSPSMSGFSYNTLSKNSTSY
jgi:hypothetical protein